jgi:membrane protease YdiL (CAAX protease family)
VALSVEMRPQTPEEALQRRRLREGAILFTLFVAPAIFAPGDVGSLADRLAPIVAVVIRNVAFALLIVYLTDIQGERDAVTGSKRFSPATVVIAAAGLFGISFITALVAGLFGEVEPSVFAAVPPGEDELLRWIPLAVMMLSVAWVEELFFRGYLLTRLRQVGASSRGAIVVAALLFSVGHGYQGVGALVFSFAAGLFLGILWVRKPSIVNLTIGHAIYNVVALALMSYVQ